MKYQINSGKPNKIPRQGITKIENLFQIDTRDGRRFAIKVSGKDKAEKLTEFLSNKCFFSKTYEDLSRSSAYQYKNYGEPTYLKLVASSKESIDGWNIDQDLISQLKR